MSPKESNSKWKYGFTIVPQFGTNMRVNPTATLGQYAFPSHPLAIIGSSGGMGIGSTARSALSNPRSRFRPRLERRQLSQHVTTGGDRRW